MSDKLVKKRVKDFCSYLAVWTNKVDKTKGKSEQPYVGIIIGKLDPATNTTHHTRTDYNFKQSRKLIFGI